MKILNITAEEDRIVFTTDGESGDVLVRAYSPAQKEEKLIGETAAGMANGVFSVPRTINGRDGLTLRYSVERNGVPAEGKKYAEDLAFPSEYDYEYPKADSIKGLQVTMIRDAIELGVRHAALNVCIGDLMRSAPSDETIPFRWDGADYYFDRKLVEQNDSRIRELSDAGIIVTLILLCSRRWSTNTPADMYRPLLHPDYLPNQDDPDVHLSAFNMTTDEGVRHYCAFIAFLTERYADPSRQYGRAVGMIVSNEVNSQWIWGNAGLKTAEEYMTEYTAAMRLAWQTAVSVYRNQRLYVSLDHFWTGANGDDPRKYYGSKTVLELLNRNAREEGCFYWNVAFHPYPEDLRFPDFWNDKTASDSFDTYRITFKNLRVLADFLEQEEYLYRGNRRRIILSEQGFNSHWTPESEILQACAYGRAYRVCMGIPEIDSFILHAHCDNAGEFGLNLGLWRRKKDEPGLDAPKPIYYVFKNIDKKDETGRWHWERY